MARVLSMSVHALANRRYRARGRGEDIPILTCPYSDAEKKLIIEAYSSNHVNLKRLSLELGRQKSNISRFARALGLTNRNRQKIALQRKPLIQMTIASMRGIGKWTRSNHPRGMLGKKHKKSLRPIFSERSRRMWANPNFLMNSDAYRQKASERMTRWRASNPITNPYSRAKRGRRSDLGGMFFKSRWEANFARYLNFLKSTGNIFAWEYEKLRFTFDAIKRGTRSYLPDFAVWDKSGSEPYFYEVKGWMDKKSEIRLKRMALYFPAIKIIVIDAKQYRTIEKQISSAIPHWESRNDPTCDVKQPLPILDLPK